MPLYIVSIHVLRVLLSVFIHGDIILLTHVVCLNTVSLHVASPGRILIEYIAYTYYVTACLDIHIFCVIVEEYGTF